MTPAPGEDQIMQFFSMIIFSETSDTAILNLDPSLSEIEEALFKRWFSQQCMPPSMREFTLQSLDMTPSGHNVNLLLPPGQQPRDFDRVSRPVGDMPTPFDNVRKHFDDWKAAIRRWSRANLSAPSVPVLSLVLNNTTSSAAT
ncbi:hypothetical protein RUND412_010581 [Rhizina undulata]